VLMPLSIIYQAVILVEKGLEKSSS